jgi:hypothetical protein
MNSGQKHINDVEAKLLLSLSDWRGSLGAKFNADPAYKKIVTEIFTVIFGVVNELLPVSDSFKSNQPSNKVIVPSPKGRKDPKDNPDPKFKAEMEEAGKKQTDIPDIRIHLLKNRDLYKNNPLYVRTRFIRRQVK